MSRFAIGILVLGLLMSGPALAKPKAAQEGPRASVSRMTLGYTYYNRPGATLEQHNADVQACFEIAQQTYSVDEIYNSYSARSGDGLVGAAVGGALSTAYHRGVVASSLENCMVVRGWRVVRLPDAVGQNLTGRSQQEVQDALAPQIGAETPVGEIVRVWSNEAARGSTQRAEIRPPHQNDGQLGLVAGAGRTVMGLGFTYPAPPQKTIPGKSWPKGKLAPAKFATAPAGSAIIVVGVRNPTMDSTGLILRRIGDRPGDRPGLRDGAPDEVVVFHSVLGGGGFSAFAVPPGRWRMSALGAANPLVLCLGAPAFEVRAGEVLYLGLFDMKSEDVSPDQDVAAAKAFLGKVPQADQVEPAAWVNGTTDACEGSQIYALEFKGAPYEPGYHYGGAFRP